MTVTTRVDLGRVEVVTMRELTLHTAAVIDRVRAQAKPAVVTRHGRLLALMHPLMTGSAARILELALADGILTLPEPGAEGVLVETLLSEESPQEPGAISGAGRTGQRYGVITSQSLSQRPSAVLARVEDGERLVVTRHGRFMVFLLPLPKEMTAQLLASAVAFLASLDSGSRDGEGYGYPVDLAEILAGR